MNVRILSLVLAMSLSLQAESLRIIADTMNRQSGLQKLFRRKRTFSYPKSNISSLDGLDQIPGIENIREVNVPNNNIRVVVAGTFNNPKFKNILWLNLSHNKIRIIEPGAFEGLENLEILLLGSNLLSTIQPGAFKGLNKLKELWLYDNPGAAALVEQLSKELPGVTITIKKMTTNDIQRTLAVVGALAVVAIVGGVVVLSMRGGATEGREPTGGQTVPQQEPYIHPRRIDQYNPEELQSLFAEQMTMGPRWDEDARRLDLSNLGLTSIEGLQKLEFAEAVTDLYLDHNQLGELPESFGDFRSLSVLYLNNNQLHELPKSFDKLTKLHTLFLDVNRFSELPESIFQLPSLHSLYLSGNEFSDAEKERIFGWFNTYMAPRNGMMRGITLPKSMASTKLHDTGHQKTTHVAQKSAHKKKGGTKLARHGKKEKTVAA